MARYRRTRKNFEPSVRTYSQFGNTSTSMCDRWLKFENFREDMGEQPEGYALGRKDKSKGYDPGNCYWVPAGDPAADDD